MAEVPNNEVGGLEAVYKQYEQLPTAAQLGLSIAPGTGEAISAYETPMYAKETAQEFEEGDVLGTLGSGAMTALSGLGAIPLVGTGIRAVKGAAKGLRAILKSDDSIESFQKAWKKMPENKVSQRQAQKPSIKKAAQQFEKGEITGKELRNIIKADLPMKLIDEVQEVPSFEDIIGALHKSQVKKGIVGLGKKLKGLRVATRLDIPAYNNHDKWIVSIHEGLTGPSTAYGKTARLTDVVFGSSPKTALDIATEKLKPTKELLQKAKEKFFKKHKRNPTSEEVTKMRSDPKNMRPQAKSTIARMEGDWVDTSDNRTVSFAKNLFKRQKDGKYFDKAGEEWIQVGMNPYRGSYFYDKATGQALQAADEVIQVGPLVFARGVRKPTLSEYKKNFVVKVLGKDKKVKKKIFKRGGMVARNPYPEARAII